MGFANALTASLGWSYGYSFFLHTQHEKRLRDAKNNSQLALNLYTQISLVAGVVKNLATSFPKVIGKATCLKWYQIVYYGSIPFAFLIAETKAIQEDASLVSKIRKVINDHIGKINQAVVIATAVGYLVKGRHIFGGSLLVGIAYGKLDQMGHIPKKVSEYVKSYMPIFVSSMLLIDSSHWIQKGAHLFTLASHFPSITPLLQRVAVLGGFEKINAPIHKRNNLPLNEITKIVQMDEAAFFNQFAFSSAHASKDALAPLRVSPNTKLEDYLDLFDRLEWSEDRTELLFFPEMNKLFITKLAKHNQAQAAPFSSSFDQQLNAYLVKSGKTYDQMLKGLLKKRLEHFINCITKTGCAASGLEAVRELQIDAYKILLHLKKLETDGKIEKIRNTLLPIAVVGGDFCSPQIRYRAKLRVHHIESDESQILEDKVQIYLQRKRLEICLSPSMADQSNPVLQYVDSLVYEKIRKAVYGFFPISKEQLNTFTAFDLVNWIFCWYSRSLCYDGYKERIFIMNGKESDQFDEYIKTWIQQNASLNDVEREGLLHDFDSNKKAFYRLALVALGVVN